jgi:NAD(P)-dependent dehydrogenase (short-subunit alcohol dehydrogenase family)
MESKVVLITGSSGIGAATARLATERGDRIFFLAKSAEECEQLTAELRDSAYSVADVADEAQVEEAVRACLARFGRIDAVFNAAGISGRSLGDGPLHECSTAAWQALMNVHAAGTFFVCRAVIQHWLGTRSRGNIVNTSSVLAHFPEPKFFATHAYAASKGAVEGMTIAAASYYASHGIRLNVLAPGLVCTPMSRRAQSDATIVEFIRRKQPLTGDFIDAEDVASVACFLLSNESAPITGEILRCDGGWAVSG